MNTDISCRRREFVGAAAAAGLVATVPPTYAAEPPPETKRIRLPRFDRDYACNSPLWIGEPLLRAEGFEDIQYVVNGQTDLELDDPCSLLPRLDAGHPLVVLSGIHVGCFALYAANSVRTIRDLKGRRIGSPDYGRTVFISAILAQVGLNARKDATLVDTSALDGVRLLADGRIDAYLGFPPEPQVMKAERIGRLILDTTVDRPWSQYFCCMAIGSREFVARHPVATRRALRALLKAADICAVDPVGTARTLVDKGFLTDYARSVALLRELPYRRWREYDSADSLRFYALRLHEVGAIRSDPKKLLAAGADWRFIEQLKKEMKT